jgi:hypothetical protein
MSATTFKNHQNLNSLTKNASYRFTKLTTHLCIHVEEDDVYLTQSICFQIKKGITLKAKAPEYS